MNIWDAITTLVREGNPRLFVLLEVEDGMQLLAMRDSLVGILIDDTPAKILAAKKMMGVEATTSKRPARKTQPKKGRKRISESWVR